jgi:hypothetical protein
MTNLQELDAGGSCGLDDYRIRTLNLIKLHVSNNLKITNVNHMTNLRELDASYDCGIDDNGIKELNLITLKAESNTRIKNAKKMIKTLKLNL